MPAPKMQYVADHRGNKVPPQVGNFLLMDAGRGSARLLAENLEFLMRRENITQKNLAKRAQVSIRRLSSIHNGTDSNPTLSTLEKIAKVLKVKSWQLLCPDLRSSIDDPTWVEKARIAYAGTSDEGRQILENALGIAEKMKEYLAKRTS